MRLGCPILSDPTGRLAASFATLIRECRTVTAQPEILYGADDLTHLEGLDAVRKRPGMYIGSTDSRGVNHLANEIIDNATDEGVGGHATKVAVTLHADGSVQIDDDGRGIPTAIN